jgi:hypothetical protein
MTAHHEETKITKIMKIKNLPVCERFVVRFVLFASS